MRPHFQNNFQDNQVFNLVGTIGEQSPIRKLFKNPAEFDFVIQQVTNHGPIHECVGITLILKQCEQLLNIVEGNIEIKPIEDGITIHSFSPRFAEMTLPLKYPNSILSLSKSRVDVEEYIGEGPIERCLANALIAQTLYYFELYINNQQNLQT